MVARACDPTDAEAPVGSNPVGGSSGAASGRIAETWGRLCSRMMRALTVLPAEENLLDDGSDATLGWLKQQMSSSRHGSSMDVAAGSSQHGNEVGTRSLGAEFGGATMIVFWARRI